MSQRGALSVLFSFSVLGCSSDGGPAAPGSPNGSGPVTPPVSLGGAHTGDGTYYDATGGGACTYDPSPNDLMVAALNAPDWAGSNWCGACADVAGPNGTVRIRIVDQCPECKSGDLDLSPNAFSKLAALDKGRITISWNFVACDVSGPVAYRFKEGDNPYWTAVQVRNSRLPVTKFEWSKDGASFKSIARTDYDYFLDASGFGPDPVHIRVTAVDGQVLDDSLPAVQAGLVVDGKAQFK
jgi:expansin (peptidoglycan-binding protein)